MGSGAGSGLIRLRSLGFALRAESTPWMALGMAMGDQTCVRQSDSCVEAGFVGGEAGRPARRLTASRWDMVGAWARAAAGELGVEEGCEM